MMLSRRRSFVGWIATVSWQTGALEVVVEVVESVELVDKTLELVVVGGVCVGVFDKTDEGVCVDVLGVVEEDEELTRQGPASTPRTEKPARAMMRAFKVAILTSIEYGDDRRPDFLAAMDSERGTFFRGLRAII
jgi:hypothetical protein